MSRGPFSGTYGPSGSVLSPPDSHDLMKLEEGLDIFTKEYESSAEYPGRRSTPHTSPISPSQSTPRCDCLRHAADLLCQLKTTNQGTHSASIDVVLQSASQTQQRLKRLLRCQNCQQNGDQEVLSLAVMSLKVVLRGLKGYLSTESDERHRNECNGMPNNQELLEEALSGIRLRLGIYEITGEQRVTMANMLVSRALRKLSKLLHELKRRLDFLKQKKDQLRLGSMSADSTPRGSSSSLTLLHSQSASSISNMDDGVDDMMHFVTAQDFDCVQELFQRVETSLSAL